MRARAKEIIASDIPRFLTTKMKKYTEILGYIQKKVYFCTPNMNKYTKHVLDMKVKNSRQEALRLIISSRQVGSQEELMNALRQEGFTLTQATLSRDMKQLKVAKASTMGGQYIYVLPNETMYKRVSTKSSLREMMRVPGFLSINFSGNMGVIKTRPGHASAIAWSIDRSELPQILGTIAGDDTIFIVVKEGCSQEEVISVLSEVVPNMK